MDHSSSDESHWCNPPPPGYEYNNNNPTITKTSDKESSPEIDRPRLIDRIDPYLKNPEYIKYEKKLRSERRRSRSRSHHRSNKRRHRSRSRSKGRHKHRRRHYSSSRSRSRSRSHSRSRRNKRRSRYSRSSSSRSRSRSRSYHRSHKSRADRSRRSNSRRRRSYSNCRNYDHNDEDYYEQNKIEQVADNVEEEEEEEEEPVNENVFKNDGSFMEMFKKMQEEMKQKEAEKTNPTILGVTTETKQPMPAFGKRRGGKVLKTGLVQKNKNTNGEEGDGSQDAWTLYMKEVKRYKEACCDDDSKTRLLVK